LNENSQTVGLTSRSISVVDNNKDTDNGYRVYNETVRVLYI